MTRLLVIAYLIYGGLLLVMAPWTRVWDRNFFVGAVPFLETVVTSRFLRGAVSGVGLIMIVGGLRDLAGMLFARTGTPPAESPANEPPR